MIEKFQALDHHELGSIHGGGIIDSIKEGIQDAIDWVDSEVIQPVRRALELDFTS